MSTATVTVQPTTPPAVSPRPRIPAEQLLATVSALVRDLDPGDDRWADAGPHLTAVVGAVRHALDGSRSPIVAGEPVPSVLRLRDLAHTAQCVTGATGVLVAIEEVSGDLTALLEATTR